MPPGDRRARCRSSGSAGSWTPDDAARLFDAGAEPGAALHRLHLPRAGVWPARSRGRPGHEPRPDLLAARPGARLAPVRRRCPRPPSPTWSPSAEGVRLRLADGRELVDGMSSLVGGDPRLPAPGAGRRGDRPARPDEPRDVRRAHPRAGGRAGPHPGRASPRPAWSTSSSATPARSASRWRSRCACSTSAVAGRPERHRLATWRGGYHGDTFHPMSVCDPEGGMHSLWTRRAARGRCSRRCRRRLDVSTTRPTRPSWPTRSRGTRDELAAVIVEPVVQGAGGMRFHHPDYLRVLREVTARARRAADLRRDRDRLRAYRRRSSPPTTPA